MQKKEDKMIETNAEDEAESEIKEKEEKPEQNKLKCHITAADDNLHINTMPTPKPKVKKTVTFELVEDKEENKMNTDIESAIATLDADIDKTTERIDEEYINFPSSQLDSIKDKRPNYIIETEDISDKDEEKNEEKKEEKLKKQKKNRKLKLKTILKPK